MGQRRVRQCDNINFLCDEDMQGEQRHTLNNNGLGASLDGGGGITHDLGGGEGEDSDRESELHDV